MEGRFEFPRTPSSPKLFARLHRQKAKQTARELSQSVSEHVDALLQHLEVPGGYLQLDSQVVPSAREPRAVVTGPLLHRCMPSLLLSRHEGGRVLQDPFPRLIT